MAAILERFGRKIASLFGEPHQGATPSSLGEGEIREQVFSGSSFANFLHYQSFDEETKLFYSSTSIGFVIESLPLVGIDDSVEKELLSIIQETMQEDSSLQFLLLADHRIESFFTSWQKTRDKELFRAMSKKRSEFLSSCKSISPRNFRLIISYSVPKGLYEAESVLNLPGNRFRTAFEHRPSSVS